MREVRSLVMTSSLFLLLFGLCALCGEISSREQNPAAWGSDHVGKPLPEFVSGDECLFCHRTDVGPNWPKNHHNQTIREPEADSVGMGELKKSFAEPAGHVKFVMGGIQEQQRCLKPSAEYGKLELFSAKWDPAHAGKAARLVDTDHPHWDAKKFAEGCAGCHASAVDAKTRAFAAVSLDCFVCHGDVDVKHSKDPALVILAKKRHDPARVVTSICAQCHMRTGKSRSTGLPYPNSFVAGDNLFRDYEVDFSADRLKELNPGDRHVLENVRDVVLLGKEEVTCLSCHNVHKQSSRKHRLEAESEACLTCHNATGSKKIVKPYEVHSKTCEY